MRDYQSLSHTKWDCKYHVVYIPKRRKQRLYGALRHELGKIFHELASQKGVLRRNPRFFRPPKLSPVEQLYAVSAQLTIRGYVAVQRLSGYPQLLA